MYDKIVWIVCAYWMVYVAAVVVGSESSTSTSTSTSTSISKKATTTTTTTTMASETGWVPSIMYANESSITWLARPVNSSVSRTRLPSGRAFHDNRIDNAGFDYSEYADHADDYKAVPFVPNEQPTAATPGTTHFHTVLKPGAVPSGSYTLASLPSASVSLSNLHTFAQSSYPSFTHSGGGGGGGGYHYPPASQYLPPSPPASQYLPPLPQNVDNFEHQHSYENTTSFSVPLETNTKNQLFVQPGKCSNSIEVGRVRDVEVRTVLKYGADTQKGVCVLMLYASNELNKLAISLQAVQGTTNIIPAGTWLETNVKMYAVQGGDVQPIFTKFLIHGNSSVYSSTGTNDFNCKSSQHCGKIYDSIFGRCNKISTTYHVRDYIKIT